MTPQPQKVPVTVLSGFLGSGKTTLLNRILASVDRSRVAVIENDLGETSVEHDLVFRTDLAQLETVEGRSCCSARVEFVRLMRLLAATASKFDRILIETTGVAHPGMVAHAILSDPELKECFLLDGIITVVDAKHIGQHLNEEGHANEQIAYADALVVNKTDLVTPEELTVLTAQLMAINSEARHYRTQEAQAPVEELLTLGGFDLRKVAQSVAGCGAHTAASSGCQDHAIASFSVTVEGGLDPERFQAWIDRFIQQHAENLFRCKGIIAIRNFPERLIFHGVHGVFRLSVGEPWADETPRSRAIFIGRGLDGGAILKGIESCQAAA